VSDPAPNRRHTAFGSDRQAAFAEARSEAAALARRSVLPRVERFAEQPGARLTFGDMTRAIYLPPVTSMKAPVVNDAWSDNSQRMARATSSGSPPRFIGTKALTRSTRPGSPPLACISV